MKEIEQWLDWIGLIRSPHPASPFLSQIPNRYLAIGSHPEFIVQPSSAEKFLFNRVVINPTALAVFHHSESQLQSQLSRSTGGEELDRIPMAAAA